MEDIMSANATPNDMRFAWINLCSILECRTAIGHPCHLKDTSRIPHTFDPQPWPETAMCAQVIYHLTYRDLETRFLVRCQAIPVT